MSLKNQLLKTSLELLPKYGFSQQLIHEAARQNQLPSTAGGLISLPILFSAIHSGIDQQLTLSFADKKEEKFDYERVSHVMKKRLELWKPFDPYWPQMISVMTQPANITTATKTLFQTSDEISYLSGDRSFNFNYYTRRAKIAAIYASCETFMHSDQSPEKTDTMDFCERRCLDASRLEQFGESLEKRALLAGHSLLGLLK